MGKQLITAEASAGIDQAESFPTSPGLQEIRILDHFPAARMEFGKDELEKAGKLRSQIASIRAEAWKPLLLCLSCS